jgi:hypothetical protein
MDSNQYKDVLDLVLDKGRVLINGSLGTGKTWMGLKVGAMLEKLGSATRPLPTWLQ